MLSRFTSLNLKDFSKFILSFEYIFHFIQDPNNSLQMADLVVSDGYHDVGYTYVNVDDCWLSHERDRRGRLQADPLRFPSGMGALADYVSSAGDVNHLNKRNSFHLF